MEEAVDIDEEDFRKLSMLVDDLRHESGNSLAVLDGFHQLYVDHVDEVKEEVRELREFIDDAEMADNYAETVAWIPEDVVESLMTYSEKSDSYFQNLEKIMGVEQSETEIKEAVGKVAKVTRDVRAYQQRVENGDVNGDIEVSELLEPLENTYEKLNGRNGFVVSDFDYQGFEDTELDLDHGYRLVTWTLAKNWEEHAYSIDQEVELGLNVDETDCFHEIDIYNSGPGLFDEYPGEDPKSAETRYRHADNLFKFDEGEINSGHGLPMARDISELYGAEIFYSEEMLEGEGFGIKIKVPKY
jgi:hypothetical protein